MKPQDYTRLLGYYSDALQEFGERDARSVHWSDYPNQQTRFLILSHIADLSNQSVLDVGCGLGDLYKFFLAHRIPAKYTGIDIVPNFVVLAAQRFPDTTFIAQDIFSVSEQYDYVLASGALSFKVENNNEYYFSMIKKMFSLSRKGLAFNMLNHAGHVDNETYAAYDPNEVADFCKTLSPRVELVVGYLPQDFTIYMYRKG